MPNWATFAPSQRYRAPQLRNPELTDAAFHREPGDVPLLDIRFDDLGRAAQDAVISIKTHSRRAPLMDEADED